MLQLNHGQAWILQWLEGCTTSCALQFDTDARAPALQILAAASAGLGLDCLGFDSESSVSRQQLVSYVFALSALPQTQSLTEADSRRVHCPPQTCDTSSRCSARYCVLCKQSWSTLDVVYCCAASTRLHQKQRCRSITPDSTHDGSRRTHLRAGRRAGGHTCEPVSMSVASDWEQNNPRCSASFVFLKYLEVGQDVVRKMGNLHILSSGKTQHITMSAVSASCKRLWWLSGSSAWRPGGITRYLEVTRPDVSSLDGIMTYESGWRHGAGWYNPKAAGGTAVL
jgi:hypothetical protein